LPSAVIANGLGNVVIAAGQLLEVQPGAERRIGSSDDDYIDCRLVTEPTTTRGRVLRISRFRVFRVSGRFSVIVATRSTISTRTASSAMSSNPTMARQEQQLT
jgi:hypothetical protein